MKKAKIHIVLNFFTIFLLNYAQAQVFDGITFNYPDKVVPRYEKFEIQIDSLYKKNGQAFKTFGASATENLFYKHAVFNSEVIQLWCVYISPSKKTFKVPGFFNRNVIINPNSQNGNLCNNGSHNVISNNSGDEWQIRFTPTEEGLWTYDVYALDSLIMRNQHLTGSFLCVAKPNQTGFVKKQDERYFMYDNGEPYIPVGQNVYMGSLQSLNQLYCYYRNYFDSVVAAGSNFARIGFSNGQRGITVTGLYTSWSQAWPLLVYWNNEMNHLIGFEMDSLFSYIDQHDIRMNVGLFNNSNWINRDLKSGPPTKAYWEEVPIENGSYYYNTLVDSSHFVQYDTNGQISVFINHINPLGIHQPAEFFRMTNPWANRMTKDYLRYIIARWGYSPSIFTWEVMGEYDRVFQDDGIDTMYDGKVRLFDYPNKQEFLNWMDSVHQWIREYDCYKRLIVESGLGTHLASAPYNFENPKLDGDSSFLGVTDSLTDMVQTHSYSYTDLNKKGRDKMVSDLFYETGVSYSLLFPHKPYFIEEGGWPVMPGNNINLCDTQGFDEAHAGMCSSLFCGAAGSQAVWDYGEIYDNGWFHYFKELKNFIDQSHLRLSQNFKNIWKYNPPGLNIYTISNSPTRQVEMKGDSMYGWVIAQSYTVKNLFLNHKNYLLYNDLHDKPLPLSEAERTISLKIDASNIPGTYRIRWYSAQDGNYYGDTIVDYVSMTNNAIKFIVPNALLNQKTGDAFFIITRDYCTKGSTTTIQSHNEEIHSATQISGDLIIPKGKSLIVDAVLNMSAGSMIMVEAGDNTTAGGQLIITANGLINGANCFDATWQGIIVEGDANAGFDEGVHGRVILQPGAQILDAEIGILSENGGVIEANGAIFTNCSTAIKMTPYEDSKNLFSNASFIRECKFIWTEQLHHTPNPYGSMIILKGVKGVQLGGNELVNADPTIFGNNNNRGTGIEATECFIGITQGGAVYYTDTCIFNFGKRGLIKGFSVGISTDNADRKDRTLMVTGHDFIDNHMDIYCHTDGFVKLSDNEFYYDQRLAKFMPGDYKYGVYTNNSAGVRIWHNEFAFLADSSCLLRINNTEADADCIIHGNRFANISTQKKSIIGNFFEGDNPLLGITCNLYQGMTTDWFLAQNCNLKSPQDYWGDVTRSAKNSFDTIGTGGIYKHIKNESNNLLIYNYTNEELSGIPFPEPHEKIGIVNVVPTNDATPCDSLNCAGNMAGVQLFQDKQIAGCVVWPNPSVGWLNIYNGSATHTRQWMLYDLNGMLLQSHTLKKGETNISIDLSHLSNGIYFYSFTDGMHQPSMNKIVIIKL